MIIAKIIMNARPEKRKEVFQTLLSMIDVLRQEKGCLSCQVFQDIEDENVFRVVQKWETRDVLEHHMRSDLFSVLLETSIPLKKQQDIRIHTVLHTEGNGIVNAVRGNKA